MKQMVLILTLVFSSVVFAKTAKWSDLLIDRPYKITQPINLADSKESFTIRKGERIRLLDSATLPMIKVQLFKFSVNNCPSTSMKTELELLEVPQVNSSAVVIGYDLDQNCVLEVFVEQKDIYSASIFK